MASTVSFAYSWLIKYFLILPNFLPGLIRYKMVIHCIIDGYSRFVLGIRVHDNNRGASVLQLLLDIIATHGCPSRMRGDHGVENIEVAIYLEEVNGSGRGSFIWGR